MDKDEVEAFNRLLTDASEPTEIKASVPLKLAVHAKVVALAKADGRSLGRYVERLIEKHVERQEKRA